MNYFFLFLRFAKKIKFVILIIEKKLVKRKGGRVVNCTNFENWRGFAVTGGSNPSLSEIIHINNRGNPSTQLLFRRKS